LDHQAQLALVVFTYDAGTNRITQITDSTGRAVTYGYRPVLTSVTDPAGGMTTYGCDANDTSPASPAGRNRRRGNHELHL
jgi:hypothetical protein